MLGRRFNDGLHQAIEAKEGVEVAQESKTLATITFQNYFRLYTKLSGMTGTAETEAGELWDIYKLDVVVIPTNRRHPRGQGRQDIQDQAREVQCRGRGNRLPRGRGQAGYSWVPLRWRSPNS